MLATTPLLVMCDSSTTAHAMIHHSRAGESTDLAEYISHPCGPRKLAKSLVICLERTHAAKDSDKTHLTLQESLESSKEANRQSREKRLTNNESKALTDPEGSDPPLRHPQKDTLEIS